MSGGAFTTVLPLPGGMPAATVRLTGLLTGTMEGPSAWFFRERGPLAAMKALGLLPAEASPHRFPVAAFLIEHPTAGNFIVDAGFSSLVAESPRRALGRVGTLVFRNPQMHASQALNCQLRARGVSPQAILMTHMHWDHASGLVDFPASRVLVDATEWQAAQARFGPLHGYLRRQFPPPARVELFDSQGSTTKPWSVFAHTLDLFGDGSVRLVATPGHSPGHTSLVLRLRDRFALIAGDALYTLRTLHEGHHPWELGDARSYHASFAAIAAFAREHPQALIMPGHDLEAWETSGIESSL